MQGHAEGLEARSPEPGRVPCGAPSPSIPPRGCSPEAQRAHIAHTGKVWPVARGRPTLMTAAQVAAAAASGSGSGSAFLAARRVPAPSAASSLPKHGRRGRWAGQGPGTNPAPVLREPAGQPLLPHAPRRAPGPPGLVSGRAHAHRTGAHTGAHSPQ